MNRILLSIIKKEFWHILRDRQTLTIVIIMPVVMLFLYGYAVTLEMKQITTVIVDHSRSPESRSLFESIISTPFFRIVDVDVPDTGLEEMFLNRRARCILVIPEHFSEELESTGMSKIQLLIDASDPNAANFIQKYMTQVMTSFYRKNHPDLEVLFSVEPRILYNPDLKSSYFFVPGLIAVIILLITTLLTSIAIVREKESGTLEQILVSPVQPYEILIGKVIPYIILGFVDSLFILAIGHFWFKVPIIGSFLTLCMILLLYILTGLSFGLFISTVTRSQQIAMMAVLLATILPSMLLSGFIFPVNSMPKLFQYLSKVIPATHFLEIIRGVMLKGNGLPELKTHILYLLLLTSGFIGISIKKFRSTLG